MTTQNLLRRLSLAGIIILGTATAGWADRLMLRSGSTVEGTFLGGTARQVRMEVNGQVQTFNVDDIRSIGFRDTPGTSSNQPYQGSSSNSQEYPPPPPRASNGNYPNSGNNYPNQSQNNSNYPASRVQSSGMSISADTTITIRMVDSVNSDGSRLGQTFKASLDEPIYSNGQQVVPRGADVLTKIVNEKDAGKLAGRDSLTLAISQIWIDGRFVDVTSTDVQMDAGSQTARTAKVVGGTAALGAIIGAIAGGGKGAAIGAGSGAAVGGVATVVTKGPSVKIPSETRLTFRLQSPVSW